MSEQDVNVTEQRRRQAQDAPKRRYEDARAAGASAADRIAQATDKTVETFRSCFSASCEELGEAS